MPKKTKISQEDLDAFHAAVSGTKPIQQSKIRLANPALKQKAPAYKADVEHTPLAFNHFENIADVQGEEFIAYKQVGISNKILRKLRKGQYNVEANLDLHGMSADEARAAVDQFLQYCLTQGIRVALIIHGKGHHSPMPVLKNKLNHWLREINVILAFCSAAPSHGSRGAIYVLLKRTTEEDFS